MDYSIANDTTEKIQCVHLKHTLVKQEIFIIFDTFGFKNVNNALCLCFSL